MIKISPVESHITSEQNGIVTLSTGIKTGIQEGMMFNVYDGNILLGEIKVKEVADNSATCKVKTGDDLISSKISQGVKLKVVSIEED